VLLALGMISLGHRWHVSIPGDGLIGTGRPSRLSLVCTDMGSRFTAPGRAPTIVHGEVTRGEVSLCGFGCWLRQWDLEYLTDWVPLS
jgi:hypothetical protein